MNREERENETVSNQRPTAGSTAGRSERTVICSVDAASCQISINLSTEGLDRQAAGPLAAASRLLDADTVGRLGLLEDRGAAVLRRGERHQDARKLGHVVLVERVQKIRHLGTLKMGRCRVGRVGGVAASGRGCVARAAG